MRKLVGLDILKIIFMLIIAFFHIATNLKVHFNDGYWKYLDVVITRGAVFMVGFFMLSGFVLQYTYHDSDFTDKKNVISFVKKRFIGIYPLYIAFLVIVFCFKLSFPDTSLKIFALLPIELFCLQSFFPTTFNICGNGGTWFVSVIILLYILFPKLSVLAKKIDRRKKWLLICVLGTISSYIGLVQNQFGGNLALYYTNFIFRVPEFLIGILLADIFIQNGEQYKFLNLVTAGFATCIFTVAINKYNPILTSNYVQYNFISIPYFCVLIFAFARMKGNKLNYIISKPVSLAFAFYLTQTFANRIVSKLINKAVLSGDDRIVIIACSLVLNLCFALIMHYIIEVPVKKFLMTKLQNKEIA